MKTFICPHADRCPGCPYLGDSYDMQLEAKAQAVSTALGGYPSLEPVEIVPTNPASPVTGYRTRLKWVAGPQGALGLYERGTHVVVDTPDCIVAQPVLLDVGRAARKLLKVDGHRQVAAALTALDLREIAGGTEERVIVTLVVRDDRGPGTTALRAFAEALVAEEPRVFSVGWSARSHASPQILGHEGGVLVGPAQAIDRVGTVEVIARAGSFVQAHRGQAALIERALCDATAELARDLGRPARVLELYAGSGALGIALARAGAEVVAVESFGPAARSIGEAAARMGVRVTFEVADAEDFVRRHRDDPFDVAVVDPPRRGLPPSVRAALAGSSIQRLLYVSCDPTTFARDLADLARRGLMTERVMPIDMFPLTDHVETFASLKRAPVPAPRVLHLDEDLVCFDKPAHESTAELGVRVRATTPFTESVPLTSLPTFASGPVLFARVDGGHEPRLEIARTVRLQADALLKGIASDKGSIGRPLRNDPEAPRTKYKRTRVVGGHSLTRLSTHGDIEVPLTHVSMLGHPVVGDPKRCDEPTRRHFFEKHGLDRAFVWVSTLSFEKAGKIVEVEATEPADLQAVRESLER